MSLDRLDALLRRFQVEARLFHAGPLCGAHDFDAAEGAGHLHLVKRGPVTLHHAGGRPIEVREPSLVFYPAPFTHRFAAPRKSGADVVCASVHFGGGGPSPIAAALPPFVVLALDALDGLEPTLDLLFAEAFGGRCGRQAAVNRLLEVAIIQVLRFAMVEGRTSAGMLAGLADAGLARALVAMHEKPGHAWTLERLAVRAGMSRSRFAARFHAVVGTTPGAYLAEWRITVARDLLRHGRPLGVVAGEVGYGSAPALSRAFRAVTGQSPREWKRSTQ